MAEIVVRICLSVLGTVFNVLVCLTFWFSPRLVSNSTLLLCNLSAADLVTSLLGIPVSLHVSFLQFRSNGVCALGTPTKPIPWNTGVIVATFTGSISNLVVMSLDRCFMIRLPFSYKNFVSARKIKVVILLIWMSAIIGFVCITKRLISQDLFAKAAFTILVVCYLIIIVCYVLVFWGIKKQKKVIASNTEANNTALRQQVVEGKLAKTIAIIITVFSISWAPLGYTMLQHSDFETFANTNPLIHWAATVGMATAVINPLIYFGRKKEYRNAALQVFRIRG